MSDDCVCGHPKVRHDPPGGECYESGCKCRTFLNGGDYTPTTEQVRVRMREWGGPSAVAAFDRWLDAHDAEVRADQQERDAQIVERRFAGVLPVASQSLAAAIRGGAS